MQEEVENRTVNLAISTTKLTFRTIVNGYNAWKRHHQAKVAQKTAQLPVGKQSIKELIGQNQGVSSIPIEKTDLKGFEQVARKYGVDYAISLPPSYVIGTIRSQVNSPMTLPFPLLAPFGFSK